MLKSGNKYLIIDASISQLENLYFNEIVGPYHGLKWVVFDLLDFKQHWGKFYVSQKYANNPKLGYG